MGNEESTSGDGERMMGDFQSSYTRVESDRNIGHIIPISQKSQNFLGNFGYAGIWKICSPSGVCPPPRGGQFSVYAPQFHKLFIGYGSNTKEELFNDLWSLDLNNYVWERIPLTGDVVSPRTGTRAILVNNNIVCYGGYRKDTYLADLHVINPITGQVVLIETHGDAPGPRSTPVLAYNNMQLFVWGGYDGTWPTMLHILDLSTYAWRAVEPNIQGRTAIPFARVGGTKFYAYGCSKTGGFVVIDTVAETASILKSTKGDIPKSMTMSAGMVNVNDEFLFFYGGKIEKEFCNMYVYDIKNEFWFRFPMRPDDETVSFYDGTISKDGYFKLPKKYNYTFCYNENKRELLACFGYPHQEVVCLSVLYIGDALSVLHLQCDMKEMLLL